jgi:hypothetical protein
MLDKDGSNWGPWTITERRVIYEYVNSWISAHGLDAFAAKTWARHELEFVAETINAVNTRDGEDAAPRSVSGVWRQICQLREGRLGPLAKLAKRSEALKLKCELGRDVLRQERFPDMAVPVPVVVDGMYVSEDCGVGPVSDVDIVKDGSVAGDTEETREDVGHESDARNTMDVQTKKRELIIKLPVDWALLDVREDGKMVVLDEGEVSERPPT